MTYPLTLHCGGTLKLTVTGVVGTRVYVREAFASQGPLATRCTALGWTLRLWGWDGAHYIEAVDSEDNRIDEHAVYMKAGMPRDRAESAADARDGVRVADGT